MTMRFWKEDRERTRRREEQREWLEIAEDLLRGFWRAVTAPARWCNGLADFLSP